MATRSPQYAIDKVRAAIYYNVNMRSESMNETLKRTAISESIKHEIEPDKYSPSQINDFIEELYKLSEESSDNVIEPTKIKGLEYGSEPADYKAGDIFIPDYEGEKYYRYVISKVYDRLNGYLLDRAAVFDIYEDEDLDFHVNRFSYPLSKEITNKWQYIGNKIINDRRNIEEKIVGEWVDKYKINLTDAQYLHIEYMVVDTPTDKGVDFFEKELREYLDLQTKELQKDLEGKAGYLIYQVKDEKLRTIGFEGYNYLRRNKVPVDINNYDLAYASTFSEDENYTDDTALLDKLWETFNINKPADYKARSMSVSDVIVVIKDEKVNSYYVDRYGFVLLDDFIELEDARMKLPIEKIQKKTLTAFALLAESHRRLANKEPEHKEELLRMAELYDMLSECTEQDIKTLYNSGVFNDITKAYTAQAMMLENFSYEDAKKVRDSIDSLHEFESIDRTLDVYKNADNEESWNKMQNLYLNQLSDVVDFDKEISDLDDGIGL